MTVDMPLSSNIVNYLVWRYLQEAGYGNAAQQLSRGWNREPDTLPFARHVAQHTLINLLQDGLWFDKLQAEAGNGEQRYHFGRDHGRPYSARNGEMLTLDQGVPAHLLVDESNGAVQEPPPKRKLKGKKSKANGIVPSMNAQINGDAMEVEQNGNTHVSNSVRAESEAMASEAESATVADLPISTLSIGLSTEIQTEVIADLAPNTTFLADLHDPEMLIEHTSWGTRQQPVLLTAGRSLLRVNLLSKDPTPTISAYDLALPMSNFSVTALCWNSHDEVVVSAREECMNELGDKMVVDKLIKVVEGGTDYQVISASAGLVNTLQWNKDRDYLLSISTDGEKGSIKVWKNNNDALPAWTDFTETAIYDALWISESSFVVCGIQLFQVYEVQEDLTVQRTLDTQVTWETLKYDPTSGIIAALGMDGQNSILGILHPSDSLNLRIQEYPDLYPMNLDFRPVTVPPLADSPIDPSSTYPVVLATCSMSGAIRVWDANEPFQCLKRLSTTDDSQAFKVAFSPDGALLAAAGPDAVTVWDVRKREMPIASWRAQDFGHEKWDPGVSGEFSLGWDPDGSRLSIALGNQVAIVPVPSPIENFRPLKVIVIGAGYSGIYCGIRIPERLKNVDLVIYEKNAGVGGAWYENRYLGCACDVPSHSYQYSFEPNKNWSSLYAPAREIQAYLEGVAKKYSANRFIKLSHEIQGCRWDEAKAKWHATAKNLSTGETFDDTSDVLISARGNLNTPAWPDINGLKTFKGELMHSATWNEKYDFADKRIAVIGTGSSSIQIVPSLQRISGTHVTTFARSKTWISPPFGQQIWDKYSFDGFQIPQEVRDLFANDPEHYQKFRLLVEEDGNGVHPATIKGTPIQLGARQMFEENMKQRLAAAPHIFESLLPSFSPGCRRLTPGPGYLEALTQPNVAFVTSPISKISESAVHTADGQTHTIDALVCATGFRSAVAPPFPITGSNNRTIQQKWETRATTYLSHSTAGFPNLFNMLGPNAAIGSGSLTMMIETVGDYIVKAVRKMQKENIGSMAVKQEREDDFIEYVDAYFEKTVFKDECNSWYKNKAGQIVGLWPGSTLHCIECMRSPRWEDFDYTYVDEHERGDESAAPLDANGDGGAAGGGRKGQRRVNRLAWLGNGNSVNNEEGKHLAWYLYPEFEDRPVAPRPEDKARLAVRPFSY
ncbi:hypothetical protein BDV95DRAFT_623896 [Massariosphaeria phaeospora]|uniref:LisH domain-containing protein n=1 Tax=Massariosphaeria phaeospora TaxID=100035 RepID=A0A7C8I063_9PLEO|nr:hypothetical protein BDV95DRAFT_623896 [Massariosphaeria phaeospora]